MWKLSVNTQIFTAYHRFAPLIKSASIIPIHVGRALADQDLPHMIGDDTGDNISDRNESYCELTALYWAWKNAGPSDYVGLMHYRRVLDLQNHHGTATAEVWLEQFDIDDWLSGVENWLGTAPAYDIAVPKRHLMGLTVAENYRKNHAPGDYDLMRDVIARDHPDYLDSFDKVSGQRSILLGNIAVMRREIFDRYCAWLFDILAKVEAADVDRSHYTPRQFRYLGFLAERLMTVFVAHEQATNPKLVVREPNILNLSQACVTPYLADDTYNAPEFVNIAFSADRNYLPHLAAMLRSVFDHRDPDRILNLFFLKTNIDERSLAILRDFIGLQDNVIFHEINAGHRFKNSHMAAGRSASNATYNRLLLFALLPQLNRLLYLDVDLIVRTDVCKLFDTDIGTAQIAGVTDWIMTRTLAGPVPTADPSIPDMYRYQRDVLHLSDAQIDGYINAGVALFNFAQVDDMKATYKTLMDMAEHGRYLFRDQDILNSHFRNACVQLDARWNVFNSDLPAFDRVPRVAYAKAMEARKDPMLVHFADKANKPWKGRSVLWADLYWTALSRTPFYGEIIRKMAPAPGAELRAGTSSKIVSLGRDLSEKFPILRGPMLRTYSALLKQFRQK